MADKIEDISGGAGVPFLHSITFRHCLSVFLMVGFVLWIVPLSLMYYTKKELQSSVMQVMNNYAEERADRIHDVLLQAEEGADDLRKLAEENKVWEKSANEVYAVLENVLVRNPVFFLGGAIAFVPNVYPGEIQAFYLQQNESSEGIVPQKDSLNGPANSMSSNYVAKRLDEEDNAYLSREWYKVPAETGEPRWSEPYFDDIGSEKIIATYSVPIHSDTEGKKLVGIVTIDVDLSLIHEMVNEIQIYESGGAILSSEKGVFFYEWRRLSSDGDWARLRDCMVYRTGQIDVEGDASLDENNITNKLFSLEKWVDVYDLKSCHALLKAINNHEKLIFTGCIDTDNLPEWVSVVPVGTSGWSLIFIVDEEEAIGGFNKLKKIRIIFNIFFTLLFIGMVPWFSLKVTRPIVSLSSETQKIANGNLNNEVKGVTRKDEIGVLANSIDTMRQSLKTYIANLGETLIQQERAANELKIAGDIQQSFLPKDFTQNIIKECSLYAVLTPAKGVGGDLYSYFTLPDGRLFFTVGDVSGKGMPASLFMAVTLTLMKGMRQYRRVTAADILKRVGHELYLNNDRFMFVTVFCGIFDPQTGILEYSNAGHLPPVILNPNKEARWLDLPTGLVLGVTKYPVYTNMQVQLEPGETVIIYTDGVNEAMNKDNQLWGYDRLIDSVRSVANADEKTIVDTLCSSLREYVGAAEQSDDITVMAVRYKGK